MSYGYISLAILLTVCARIAIKWHVIRFDPLLEKEKINFLVHFAVVRLTDE